ncbi:phosphoglucomutase [Spirochaetia bacterium]|nr:phosphoglucomutase [Spirochaetia bacterium]
MILSASGWRAVFAPDGNEEGRGAEITAESENICRAAALSFSNFLKVAPDGNKEGRGAEITAGAPTAIVGMDTRPTGPAIARVVISTLAENGCRVLFAGVTAAPEIFAFARDTDLRHERRGFIFISASHNPIGYNGFKFGLADGGVLTPPQAESLAEDFKARLRAEGKEINHKGHDENKEIYQNQAKIKAAALNSYRDFTKIVAEEPSNTNGTISKCSCGSRLNFLEQLKHGIAARPIGIAADFNGSARTVSIDREFFESLGLKFKAINDKAGEIVHKIVPEEDALLPCCRFLEDLHRNTDECFVLGYVPDCDGDRGNLVIWDDDAGQARPLAAQEVFALACMAELAHQNYSGAVNTAIAINDPTSLRVNVIAEKFGAAVFRAEVGEANVVALGKKLRGEGWNVRFMGEGAAGGVITHPQAVRDPLHTVLSVIKLLTLPELLNLWLKKSGAPVYSPHSISGIIKTLPPFVTTGAYSADAKMEIRTEDHALLKRRYGEIFMRQWEAKKSALAQFGIVDWEAACYNGITETAITGETCKNDFGVSGKGGLKICFKDAAGKKIAAIWMRGSGTEPVFRIMAESSGIDPAAERFLIAWQREMTEQADKECSAD